MPPLAGRFDLTDNPAVDLQLSSNIGHAIGAVFGYQKIEAERKKRELTDSMVVAGISEGNRVVKRDKNGMPDELSPVERAATPQEILAGYINIIPEKRDVYYKNSLAEQYRNQTLLPESRAKIKAQESLAKYRAGGGAAGQKLVHVEDPETGEVTYQYVSDAAGGIVPEKQFAPKVSTPQVDENGDVFTIENGKAVYSLDEQGNKIKAGAKPLDEATKALRESQADLNNLRSQRAALENRLLAVETPEDRKLKIRGQLDLVDGRIEKLEQEVSYNAQTESARVEAPTLKNELTKAQTRKANAPKTVSPADYNRLLGAWRNLFVDKLGLPVKPDNYSLGLYRKMAGQAGIDVTFNIPDEIDLDKLDDYIKFSDVTPATTGAPQEIPQPQSQEEYDALPSGAAYLSPNGIPMRKP